MKSSYANYVDKLKEILVPLSGHMKPGEEEDLAKLEEKHQSTQGASESMAKSFGRTKDFVHLAATRSLANTHHLRLIWA